MSVLRILNGFMDRIFVVSGAFLGSQFPTLMQQYSSRLSGHINELQYQIGAWRKMAALSNKTLSEYLYKFSSNSDSDFVRHGEHMQTMIARFNDLSHSQQAFNESTIWSRPFIFIANLNGEIFQSTLHSFTPQMTLTLEGAYYTVLGLIFGYIVYQLLIKTFRVSVACMRLKS